MQLQDGECRHHHPPFPRRCAVEPVDEEDSFAERFVELHTRRIDSCAGRQFHGDVLGFDDRIRVGYRGELGDHPPSAVGQDRLGSGAAHRGAVEKGAVERGCERHASLDTVGDLGQFGERHQVAHARRVIRGGFLEVEGTDPVGSGFEQVVEPSRVGGLDRAAVLDYASPPSVGSRVGNTSRYISRYRVDLPSPQRQLRKIQRHGTGPTKVATAIGERDDRAPVGEFPGNYRFGCSRQPHPHERSPRFRCHLRSRRRRGRDGPRSAARRVRRGRTRLRALSWPGRGGTA